MKSIIFDVSNNEVYKENGGYHVFCGHDASVALAKMNFNDEYFDRSKLLWNKDLDKEELVVLADWVDFYAKRYPIVGYIKEEIEEAEEKNKDL